MILIKIIFQNSQGMILIKIIFQNRYVALETPLRPPPLHGKCHHKFPFWFFDSVPNCLCTACIITELLLVSFPLVSDVFFWGKCQCQYICTNVDVNRAVTAIYDLTKLQRARQKCENHWQQNTLITLCCTTWIHSPRTTSRLHNLFGHTGLQDVPTKVLSECCWNHSALAQSQVAGTPCVWKLNFWSFLT